MPSYATGVSRMLCLLRLKTATASLQDDAGCSCVSSSEWWCLLRRRRRRRRRRWLSRAWPSTRPSPRAESFGRPSVPLLRRCSAVVLWRQRIADGHKSRDADGRPTPLVQTASFETSPDEKRTGFATHTYRDGPSLPAVPTGLRCARAALGWKIYRYLVWRSGDGVRHIN